MTTTRYSLKPAVFVASERAVACLIVSVLIAASASGEDEKRRGDLREVNTDQTRLFLEGDSGQKNAYEELSKGMLVDVVESKMDGDQEWLRVVVRDSSPSVSGWVHSSRLSPAAAVASPRTPHGTKSPTPSMRLLFPADADAVNRLGFRLLQQAGESGNPTVSPYGVWSNARLWLKGARGETAVALQRAFGFDDLRGVEAESGPGFASRNRLLKRSQLSILDDYRSFLEQQDCSLLDTDFDDASRVDMNAWISECSGNQITGFFEPSTWPKDIDALYVNVTSVQSAWSYPIPRDTKNRRKFQCSVDTAVTPIWLATTESVRFHESRDASFRAIVIPCENSQLAGVVILPNRDSPVAALLERPGPNSVSDILESPEALVHFEIPEFQCSASTDLMRALGLQKVMSATSDFPGISTTPLTLSAMVQGAQLNVTEAGVSAAAVTYSSATVSADGDLFKPDHELIADRPFLFALVHVPTRSTLFMAHVMTPALQD